MADISRGQDFTDGVADDVTAAKLQNNVDLATILPGFIIEKPLASPVGTDSIVYYQASQTRLARAPIFNIINLIPGGQTTDPPAGTRGLRSLGTGALQAAAGNDARFPAAITGPRKGNGASADTLATGADLALGTTTISGTTPAINWALLGGVFTWSLSANSTPTFTNTKDSQAIIIKVTANGHTINWPTLTGADPAPTAGSTRDIYTFMRIGSGIVGAVKSV